MYCHKKSIPHNYHNKENSFLTLYYSLPKALVVYNITCRLLSRCMVSSNFLKPEVKVLSLRQYDGDSPIVFWWNATLPWNVTIVLSCFTIVTSCFHRERDGSNGNTVNSSLMCECIIIIFWLFSEKWRLTKCRMLNKNGAPSQVQTN